MLSASHWVSLPTRTSCFLFQKNRIPLSADTSMSPAQLLARLQALHSGSPGQQRPRPCPHSPLHTCSLEPVARCLPHLLFNPLSAETTGQGDSEPPGAQTQWWQLPHWLLQPLRQKEQDSPVPRTRTCKHRMKVGSQLTLTQGERVTGHPARPSAARSLKLEEGGQSGGGGEKGEMTEGGSGVGEKGPQAKERVQPPDKARASKRSPRSLHMSAALLTP